MLDAISPSVSLSINLPHQTEMGHPSAPAIYAIECFAENQGDG